MMDALMDRLCTDIDLTDLLPGGIHRKGQVGEISRSTTPQAFDAQRGLRPCALVAAGTQTPDPIVPGAARQIVQIFFYEAQGDAAIEPARRRAWMLLDGVQVMARYEAVYEIRWVGDVLDTRDDALDCALIVSRYEVALRRMA